MLVAIFELSSNIDGVGERGGIIRQLCTEQVAIHAVGPSDREKIARHNTLPGTHSCGGNQSMDARTVGWLNPRGCQRCASKIRF
jgi:hypothetical protein